MENNAIYRTELFTRLDGMAVEQLTNIMDKTDVKYRMILFLPYLDGALNEHKVIMKDISNIGHAFKDFDVQAKEYAIKYGKELEKAYNEIKAEQAKAKLIKPNAEQVNKINGGLKLV